MSMTLSMSCKLTKLPSLKARPLGDSAEPTALSCCPDHAS